MRRGREGWSYSESIYDFDGRGQERCQVFGKCVRDYIGLVRIVREEEGER
jgi:hypothetical protein